MHLIYALFLCLVVLLGSVLEDPGELDVVEHAVLDGRLPVHVVHVVVTEPVADGGEELPELILVDHAHVVLVEAAERVLDHILRVSSLEPFSEQGEEHGEVDGAGRLVHHALQVVLSRVLAKRSQHVVEVLFVNESVPVVVNHVEGLLELLDLVLVKHGEDIAGRPLSPLLGGSTTSCCLSGRHLDF